MTMKWIALAVVLGLALLSLPSCASPRRLKDEDIPGGLRDRSWEDAPKTIQSTTIDLFEVDYPCPAWVDENDRHYCLFTLERSDQTALCRITAFSPYETICGLEFEVPLSSLDALQSIVVTHDLARLNGISRQVNGLPEYEGSRLRVIYQSGEKIYAVDNSTSLIDRDSGTALRDFFQGLAIEAGLSLQPNGEAK